MQEKIDIIGENALAGKGISHDDASFVLRLEKRYLSHLLTWTDSIRQTFNGNKINLCSVVNARSGGCSEDCSFCSQSVHFNTGIGTYPLLPVEHILKEAIKAKSSGAAKFCLSTSGNGIGNIRELEKICEVIEKIKRETDINVCATLGALTYNEIKSLRKAGLTRFHHNLETSEAYFPNVCTTHTYQDRIDRVKIAKELGLSTCSGGIFGVGETIKDRVDLAFELNELDVDSIPINFLMPIPGTPLEDVPSLTPAESLKIIAMFRLIMPEKEIRVCGGRLTVLRDLHPLIFHAGANGMMIGNYLTRSGRTSDKDMQMLFDLGLEIATL